MIGLRMMVIINLVVLSNWLFIGESMASMTNVNEVTDFFDREITNKQEYQNSLENMRERSVGDIVAGSANSEIIGMDKTEGEVNRMNEIHPGLIEAEGRAASASEQYRFYHDGNFEPDLTKPEYQAHKKDITKIVSATNKLLLNLTSALKEYGIDCKEVKGARQQEPEFHIELKKEEIPDSIFLQGICEEPSREYSCNKVLNLTCKNKSKAYGEWQDKVIRLPKSALKDSWGYCVTAGDYWNPLYYWIVSYERDRVVREAVSSNASHVAIRDGVRNQIAAALGADISQIGEGVIFPLDGKGVGYEPTVRRDYKGINRDYFGWPEFEFSYRYREIFDICTDWQETWTERCKLK